MSFLNKKKITSRARRRQPEYKRRFFKNKTKLVGPKIYLSTRHRSKLAVSSSFWPKIYLIIFCFLALGLCYLFFGLKFWQVSEINFVDNDRLNTQKMEEYLRGKLSGKKLFLLPASHYFLLNSQELSNGLVDNFPEIKTAEVKKSFPRILKVSLKRKRPALIWAQGDPEFLDKETADLSSQNPADQDGQIGIGITGPDIMSGEDKQKKLAELAEKKQSVKYFLIDEDGVVGKEVPPENLSLSNLWLVYDRGFGELKNNQQLVDRAWLDKLKLIIQTLKEQLNLTTIYFALPSIESNELYAKIKPDASEVSVSWFIYLNLDLDLVKTLTDFHEVYRSKIINQP